MLSAGDTWLPCVFLTRLFASKGNSRNPCDLGNTTVPSKPKASPPPSSERPIGRALPALLHSPRCLLPSVQASFISCLPSPSPEVLVLVLSCVQLFETPWTVAFQALRPWCSPGKNTWVGSHSLLQGIVLIQGLNLGCLHCRQILYQLSHKEALFISQNLSKSKIQIQQAVVQSLVVFS